MTALRGLFCWLFFNHFFVRRHGFWKVDNELFFVVAMLVIVRRGRFCYEPVEVKSRMAKATYI
jgi:hypothetical protein